MGIHHWQHDLQNEGNSPFSSGRKELNLSLQKIFALEQGKLLFAFKTLQLLKMYVLLQLKCMGENDVLGVDLGFQKTSNLQLDRLISFMCSADSKEKLQAASGFEILWFYFYFQTEKHLVERCTVVSQSSQMTEQSALYLCFCCHGSGQSKVPNILAVMQPSS